MTISVPKNVREKMDKEDVKSWSAIAVDAFEATIDRFEDERQAQVLLKIEKTKKFLARFPSEELKRIIEAGYPGTECYNNLRKTAFQDAAVGKSIGMHPGNYGRMHGSKVSNSPSIAMLDLKQHINDILKDSDFVEALNVNMDTVLIDIHTSTSGNEFLCISMLFFDMSIGNNLIIEYFVED